MGRMRNLLIPGVDKTLLVRDAVNTMPDLTRRRFIAGGASLGALTLLVGAGIAAYHVGVEQGWWQGPATCTTPDPGAIAPGDLLNQILQTPVVLCDQVAWSLFGVSMAGWNAVLSLVLAALWMRAYASSSASQ